MADSDRPTLPASPHRSLAAGPTWESPPPRAVEVVLYGALLSLAAVGLVSAGQFNLLPAERILEGAFILAAALSMSRFDAAARSFLVIALAYVSVKAALMAFSGSDAWLDFIQAYKAYFYLLGLAFFVRRRFFDGPRLANVTAVLVAAFFVKYGYSRLFDLDARPGVYDENNFELIMLIGLFYVGFPYAGRRRSAVFAVLAATVVLSGSRSAALGLLVLYVASYLRLRSPFWPLHVLGLIGMSSVVFALFMSRDPEGLKSIDRYRFLGIFLREVQPWPFWHFLTGSYPITPLSRSSCGELASYGLLSHSDPSVCYSVGLHSYLLRAVFDQGLLGLGLLYVLLWMALSRSAASRRDIIVLLGIMTISGLSVSAFNNVYAATALAVALGLDRSSDARGPSSPEAVPRGRGTSHRGSPRGHLNPTRQPQSRRQTAVGLPPR